MTNCKDIEIDLLLEGIYRQRYYDFRQYVRASIMRKINALLERMKLRHISDLISKTLYDDAVFTLFLNEMSNENYFYNEDHEAPHEELKAYY